MMEELVLVPGELATITSDPCVRKLATLSAEQQKATPAPKLGFVNLEGGFSSSLSFLRFSGVSNSAATFSRYGWSS